MQSSSRYLDAAEQVARWIGSCAVPDGDGLWWPNKPSDAKPAGIDLYSGPSGVVLFLLEAYRTTGDKAYLDQANAGARWLVSKIPSVDNLGLFTGLAGAGWVLHHLARATRDADAGAGAALAIERLHATANDDGVNANWLEVTEYLWGTTGIALLLLEFARDTGDEASRALAARAGRWLMSEAKPEANGTKSWRLGEGVRGGLPKPDIIFPNFAHGTAGIAYGLATIGAEVGDGEMVDAAIAGARWLLSIARTDDDGCAVFHHDGDGTEMYTLGWCHGPPGLAALFHRLHLVTGDTEWSDWTRRAAHTVRASGIPEQKYPGFWDNVARCCGSTGVADFFLDLHRVSGARDDLDFAIAMTDDLLARATVDDKGMRWSNIEFRNDNPVLPPLTGFMQGASGIGIWLLKLHRYLQGDDTSIRLPHSPF